MKVFDRNYIKYNSWEDILNIRDTHQIQSFNNNILSSTVLRECLRCEMYHRQRPTESSGYSKGKQYLQTNWLRDMPFIAKLFLLSTKRLNLKYQLQIPSYIVSTFIPEALYGANEFIEEQNTIAENELREKVGLLKSLTIDIGEEVKGHNQLLQETDNTFDRFVHYICQV